MAGKTILIVEDEESIREMVKLALEFDGYGVLTASDGIEGIRLLKQSKISAYPCVILLDLMMPRMNGWEFVQAVSEDPDWSRIPIVLTTAYADKARLLSVKSIVKKPIDLDQLLKAIEAFCS